MLLISYGWRPITAAQGAILPGSSRSASAITLKCIVRASCGATNRSAPRTLGRAACRSAAARPASADGGRGGVNPGLVNQDNQTTQDIQKKSLTPEPFSSSLREGLLRVQWRRPVGCRCATHWQRLIFSVSAISGLSFKGDESAALCALLIAASRSSPTVRIRVGLSHQNPQFPSNTLGTAVAVSRMSEVVTAPQPHSS